MAFLPYPYRRPNQQAGLNFDSGGDGGDTGITYSGFDPYNDPTTAPTTDPDYGTGGTWDPSIGTGGAPNSGGGPYVGGGGTGGGGPLGIGVGGQDVGNENKFRSEAGYGSGFGGNVGGFGGLSFPAGLGISALSGLFAALGGVLAAQEAGHQAIRMKQTPANSAQSIAAAARQPKFAPPTQYAPTASVSNQPMLGNPNAPQNQSAMALQEKMKGLLMQVGSPQLKASRFGVGGF